MRYYVTSDTHGFYAALETALNTAGFFEDTQPHKLLIIGDLFDRGSEALRLQEFILEQMEKDLVILIKGNHEDMFEQLVTEDKGLPYGVHVHNGTYDTALQLTGFDRVIAEIRHYDFAEAAMRTPYYQKIIPAMLDYYETRNYVFTHGWLPCYPTKSGSYARIEDWRHALKDSWKRSRWYNGMDAFRTAYDEKTVVCGHWHASYGHSRFYKRWGYMSAKGVKYLCYRPNMVFNHMFKDDFLFISYNQPIIPAENDPLWYKGYDEYVFGGAILSMVKAIDRYSDCDTTEVKAAIEMKRKWFKETYPRWYDVEVREDKPFFDD